MEYSQFETVKHLEEQIKGFQAIIKFNKALRLLGLGSKEIAKQEETLKELKDQLEVLKRTPSEFNQIFSKRGWISHDSLNLELMTKMIDLSKNESIEVAEKEIIKELSPDNIQFQYQRLKALPELRKRQRFLEYARKDYLEEKYYSVIPLLLIIIDGTVNDIISKGFHSEKANLDVWDAITNIDDGIENIRSIFRKGRYTTREEPIDLPYRNGILHGTDLGYDNYIVAAKCWHFLFVIRDWALSKKTESQRRAKFEKEKHPPPIFESLKGLHQIRKEKEEISKWKKRKIDQEYIHLINNGGKVSESTPEFVATKFLALWKAQNYGYMANYYWKNSFKNSKPNIERVRNSFDHWKIKSYEIHSIDDQAAAIKEVCAIVISEDNNEEKIRIRMIFEDQKGNAKARNISDGDWKIVFVNKLQ